MASGTFKFFGKGFLKIMQQGTIDLESDTIYVMLTTVSYVPNQDTHEFRSDVTNEVSGTGYSTGGLEVTNKSLSYDSGTEQVRWISSTDNEWTGSTITGARVAVWYKSTGSAATDPLIGYAVFDGDVSTIDSTMKLDVDATYGIGAIDLT